jgi:hypothetical protein
MDANRSPAVSVETPTAAARLTIVLVPDKKVRSSTTRKKTLKTTSKKFTIGQKKLSKKGSL